MLEKDLFEHLNNDETLLLNEQIYPQIAVDNAVVPYLIFTIVDEQDELGRSLNRTVLELKYRVQIDCYESSAFKAKRLKNRVKKSLYAFKHLPTSLSARDGYVENVKMFRQIIDFKLNILGEDCE